MTYKTPKNEWLKLVLIALIVGALVAIYLKNF